MKKINDQKLQAFTNAKRTTLSRKEQDDLRKKEEEEAAANAFKEFVETFQENPKTISKVWVKAGTYDAGSRREDSRDKGKLYKPMSKLEEKSAANSAQEYAKMLAGENKKDTLKKKAQEKKKSNLELFKEELRQIQEEREERHKYKSQAKTMIPEKAIVIVDPNPDLLFEDVEMGSFDNGDPNTTNLFLGNLSPKISEQQLMDLFGKFGPLASIKIMWPRSEEEKSRGRNCGFVAYMSRKDAERALKTLNGKDIMSYEMKLGWGKSVPIMTHPIYIPPALVNFTMPPPTSGLPFNAQFPINTTIILPKMNSIDYMTDIDMKQEMDDAMKKCIVKVVVPSDRSLVALIHRMIEFVIREGPMFEAIVMNREIDNTMYRFLFENDSQSHVYYRWKLFSLLQGDTATEWRQNEFRMFEGGSIWKPPPVNFYTQGMPEELINDDDFGEPNRGALSTAQRDRLEDLIRRLTPERSKISDAMIFCIEHADAADEICECLSESVSNPETLVIKKIARLYLVSDILHNCGVKVSNASFFRKSMEKNLMEFFKGLHVSYNNLESRLKAEEFKDRVLQVINTWEEWTVYPKDFLHKLQNTFLGIPIIEIPPDIDGALSGDEKEDEDLDGVPLDGAALLKGALLRGIPDAESSPMQDIYSDDDSDDIDGVPLDDDIDGIPLEKFPDNNKSGAFIPSKWETVDPDQIEAQAITTSKWDTLEPPAAPAPPNISLLSQISDDSIEDTIEGGRDFDEDKRNRLREIELKSIQYQDELESGERSIKTGWSISQQVEHYRRKLLKKSDKELQSEMSEVIAERFIGNSSSSRKESLRDRSSSPEVVQPKKSRKSKKELSPTYSKSSPIRSSKSSKIKSPYVKRSRDSNSPPARSSKSSKRVRSRSFSESPKRYIREKSISPVPVRSTRYEYSSPRKYRSRSPSPVIIRTISTSSSRYAVSPPRSSSRRQKESPPPTRYGKSPGRHRSEKKHKHKY